MISINTVIYILHTTDKLTMGVLMVCKSTSNTRVSLWFANRPVIPAICKASNKKAPCSSMHKMFKVRLYTNSVNGLSAHTFCS